MKVINQNKFVTFFDQSKYLLEYFCITNKSNPLRKFASDESELSYKNLDYSTLNFICIEVKGDWIDILQMYVDVVHMRRFDNDRVDVKSVLTKFELI